MCAIWGGVFSIWAGKSEDALTHRTLTGWKKIVIATVFCKAASTATTTKGTYCKIRPLGAVSPATCCRCYRTSGIDERDLAVLLTPLRICSQSDLPGKKSNYSWFVSFHWNEPMLISRDRAYRPIYRFADYRIQLYGRRAILGRIGEFFLNMELN